MFEFFSTRFSAIIAQVEPSVDVPVPAPFYEQGWFLFSLLVAAVVLGWFLAQLIANNLRLNEYGGRIATVLIAVLVASLMIWSKWPPEFGVDLRGGINMVGSLNLDAWADSEDDNAEPPQAKDIIPALIQRVNPSGTKEIMIRNLGTDKIEVTIPSVNLQEADEIWDRLVEAGKLQFRIVADLKFNQPEIALARQSAEAGSRETNVVEVDSAGMETTVAYWATLAREVVAEKRKSEDDIVPVKFIPQPSHLVRDKSTGRIIDYTEIRGSLGPDPEKHGRDFAKWLKDRGIRAPQILLMKPDEDMNVEGKHLASVSSDTDEKGRACVSFKTSDEGSMRLGLFTKMNEPDSQGERHLMGIVLDDQLHSAPTIEEAIYKNGRISGNFTQEEVDDLVIKLKSGKLDVALNKAPISKDFINSTLGEELKQKGVWAIVSSLLLVLVFMLFYYRFAGIVANIGLLLNVVFILALVMAINQPLTLTGLAGLVLTVGMSVDANVLVFERIREEIDRGAALRMAIRNGFDKATTTIVDANVTTLITALVLYVIGTEQIKGFSVTLILGILMSMFTAIFVSRLIFDIAEKKRWLTKLNMTRMLDKRNWKFLNKIGVTGVLSGMLIVVGIGSTFMLGAKILDHDLRGGSTVRMVFNDAQDIEKLREELDANSIEVNGEKIEFTVSGFGNMSGDEASQDRVFKVDSNLPAWEDKDGEQKFEQLDELLARIFKGRLKLHHVDVSGQPSLESGTNESSQVVPDNGGEPEASETGMQWRSAPVMSGLSISSMMLLLQDDGVAAAQNPESGGLTLEAAEAETEPSADNDAESGSLQGDSAQSETIGDAVMPALIDEPAANEPAANEPVTEELDVEVESTADAPQDMNVEYVDITRELTVEPEISGKTLRSLLVEASQQADRELEEDQVRVTSPDVVMDESPLTTISNQWTVTMNVTQEADADRIVSVWAENFNDKPYFPTSSKVGGQIAKNTQYQALAAIIASLLGIIAYVWIRFQNVAFGLAAVIALIHDVLIVLGAIALSHWLAGALGFLGVVQFKISLEIVAALLTVIGYSLNDTIVVFDRIREVRGKRTEITAEMINASISQTLSRTILTSLTTFIVVFILYCFGGEAIHGFAFALVVGVIVGTYSSIFVASPALLWLMNTVGLNPGIVDPAAE
jgi:SecD/SecF fusion protein